jgi:glycosyltransferase involved in cell wall biosynthesis
MNMKILQVITQSELGGAQTVVVQLANNLSKEHEVVLVAGQGDGKMWSMVNDKVVKEFCPLLQRSISLKNDILAAIELRRLYKKYKPDIIHLHSSKAGTLGRIVFPSKKTVYTVHGFDSIRLKYRVFLPLEKILQFFSGAIVGVSQYDKNNLYSEKITKNVHVIHNGIRTQETSLAENFPVEMVNKKIVLTIARISPPKKIQLFLDVAKQLPEYTFIWIGGDNNCPAEKLNETYGTPNNVYLLGDIPEASRFIPLCDLFVLFSNYEGLPMTIIEAMGKKKAIVASAVGGINELVDDTNGCLIDNKVDSAVNAIKRILEDDKLRSSMETVSYQKFVSNFTLEKMWKKYKEIYNSLIK